MSRKMKGFFCYLDSILLVAWIVLLIDGIQKKDKTMIAVSAMMTILTTTGLGIYFKEKKKSNG